jgi:UDP-N-acetylglucosamine--dolichyl-phosphate N-acetylglucosaminephosphotransferase
VIVVAVAFVVALLTSLAAMPWVISRETAEGLTGNDVNKPDRPIVPNIGGIAVAFGLSLGVLVAIAVSETPFAPGMAEGPMVAAFLCVLLVVLIGVVDDLLRMPPVLKGTLPLLAALPLIVLGDGSSTVDFPLIGVVELGLLYTLILVPIGVTGAANVTNMLAGFNGVEAGMGSVACLALGLIALRAGSTEAAVLLFAMLGALLVLLRFSWYPARIFPGDTATLAIGAVLAAAVITGGFEIAGVILIIPYAVDFVIKARNKFPSTGWWGTWTDGKLVHEGRPIGLAQTIMRLTGGVTEVRLVSILIGLEVIAAVVAVVVTATL